MKVLFIGGTGIISSACSDLALSRGIELWHLNRGQSQTLRPVHGAKQLTGDIRNPRSIADTLEKHDWDVVVDFIAFVPEHIRTDIALFTGKTKQYIFISSASCYETAPRTWPVTEKTPAFNPYWTYSQNKIACEGILLNELQRARFPVTIVRPSHTYDKTLIPFEGGYTVMNRIIENKTVVIPGDGSSLWTMTHHRDFAKGLVGLFGKEAAIGETYHITSDEYKSWYQIYLMFGNALGRHLDMVFIPSNVIGRYDKAIGDSLMGDKSHSMIFDNSKIKAIVPDFICQTPLEQGVAEIVEWYRANPGHQKVDKRIDEMYDKIVDDWRRFIKYTFNDTLLNIYL